MKVIKRIFGLMPLVAAILLLAGCSSSEKREASSMLETVVSDNTEFVVVVNFNKFFEQSEIKVENGEIVLPDYLKRYTGLLGGSPLSELNSIQGIDYDNLVFAFDGLNNREMEGVMMFGLKDEASFINSMEQINEDIKTGREGGFTTLGDGQTTLLIRDNIVYAVLSDKGIVSAKESFAYLEDKFDAAASSPLSGWKKNYLTSSKVVNVLVKADYILDAYGKSFGAEDYDFLKAAGVEEIKDGYFGFYFNMDGPSIRFGASGFAQNGEPVKSDLNGKFNRKMMDYAYPTDMLAFGWSMNEKGYKLFKKSLKEVFNAPATSYGISSSQKEMIEAIVDEYSGYPAEYLSDGGLFMSGGFAANTTLNNFEASSPNSYHILASFDLKQDKAAEALREMNEIMSEFTAAAGGKSGETTFGDLKQTVYTIPFVSDGDIFGATDTPRDIKIYVAMDGNILLLSNDVIKKSRNVFKPEIFEGCMTAFELLVTPDSEIGSLLGGKLGIEADMTSRNDEGEFVLTFTGSDTNFLRTLVELVSTYIPFLG